mgnify:CR=1 FL=1
MVDIPGGDISIARHLLALVGTVVIIAISLYTVSRLKIGGKYIFKSGAGKKMHVVDVVRFNRMSGVALVKISNVEYLCPFGSAGSPVSVLSKQDSMDKQFDSVFENAEKDVVRNQSSL